MRCIAIAVGALLCAPAWADTPPDADRVRAAQARGLAYLVGRQASDGAWRSRHRPLADGPGLTAHVLASARALPGPLQRVHGPALTRAESYLLAALGSGERYFPARASYPTYATAFALGALRPPAVRRRLSRGLLALQLGAALGWSPADSLEGGWGLGADDRKPIASYVNVSTTRAAVVALARAGWPADHPGRGRALAFLARCQRREAAAGGDRWGFAFSPDPGAAKAGTYAEGPLAGSPRPYGTATADGALALLACGADPASEPLRGARGWLIRRFRADRVPGFGEAPARDWPQAMRLYWLASSAQALRALRVTERELPWRARLCAALLAAQRSDGSWTGEGALMMENDPQLATALALRALVATGE